MSYVNGDFNGCTFSGASFKDCRLVQCTLQRCTTWSSELRNCNLDGCDFHLTQLDLCKVNDGDYERGRITNSHIESSKLSKANLHNCKLANTTFYKANFTDCTFRDCTAGSQPGPSFPIDLGAPSTPSVTKHVEHDVDRRRGRGSDESWSSTSTAVNLGPLHGSNTTPLCIKRSSSVVTGTPESQTQPMDTPDIHGMYNGLRSIREAAELEDLIELDFDWIQTSPYKRRRVL